MQYIVLYQRHFSVTFNFFYALTVCFTSQVQENSAQNKKSQNSFDFQQYKNKRMMKSQQKAYRTTNKKRRI